MHSTGTHRAAALSLGLPAPAAASHEPRHRILRDGIQELTADHATTRVACHGGVEGFVEVHLAVNGYWTQGCAEGDQVFVGTGKPSASWWTCTPVLRRAWGPGQRVAGNATLLPYDSGTPDYQLDWGASAEGAVHP